MGFRNNATAKVWEVKEGKGNYTDVRLSISEKDKRTDEWQQAFQSWVRFIGKAHETLPEVGDRIKLDSVDVTNTYDKEKQVTYWNCKCFEWSPSVSSANINYAIETDDDEAPF